MTGSDPALDLFKDLDVPGKRAPVNRGKAKASSTDTTSGWDESPLRYFYNGVDREFFPIGTLGAALGKSAVTIRSWEAKGLMPRTPYRSPKPRSETLPGKPTRGKRLWTRAQIEGVLVIAKEEGILDGKPPTPRFHDRVEALYNQLREQEQPK